MNGYFKKFVICFCIVGFLFSAVRPQRANAVVGVDDAIIVIGGVAVTLYVCVEILIQSGHHLGYESVSGNDISLKEYLNQKLIAMSAAALMDLFCFKKDANNQDYLAVKNADFTEINALFESMLHSNYTRTEQTTSNTSYTDTNLQPYMLNNYYMKPYKLLSQTACVYDSFYLSANEILSYQYVSAFGGTPSIGDYQPVVKTLVRLRNTGINTVVFERSNDDGATFKGVFTIPGYKAGAYISFGYKTTSKSVVVPGDSVLANTQNKTDIDSNATIAYPISGQYDSTTNQKVYDGIEGANAQVVSGLKASDIATTTPIDGQTGSGTDAGFWSTLWGWLEKIYKGIISIPGAIEALPGEIATSFENALQYVFVPTATDFSDFYNDIEGDVKSKFPYSVSILNSLEVNADEFKDIHVVIWGHDCVIVSAQFVNNNISWIRVVTSCFWIFSLFVYVWRKINAVLNGGDVNSTTVYAPGSGGSGPPSVI